MTQDWKEDLARENYTDKWLILLIEKLLEEEREKEKRLWMLSLVHLDTKTRESILNTYAELESLKHE